MNLKLLTIERFKTIGFADKETVEKLHRQNKIKGWNSFPAGEGNANLLKTLSCLPGTTAQRLVFGYMRYVFKNPKKILKLPKCQIVILINTPKLTDKGWDFCNSCPDAILYKGRLVPSCLLERVKLGEKILI